jgi:GH15 family glucan-1,4-alpha-glucosidase
MDSSGREQLPIQEDETALLLYSLWEHYKKYRDVESIRQLYRTGSLAADFLCRYRDPVTKLPLPSYDLWEERHGIHAFTVGAVWAGLYAAANFAELFGESRRGSMYQAVAEEIKVAAGKYLWAPDLNRFLRMINFNPDGSIARDESVDSSLFGLWYFGMLSPRDGRIQSTIAAIRDLLWLKNDVGGCARYENDYYQRWQDVPQSLPGNPWFVCTLWLAQHGIACAQSMEELSAARAPLEWVCNHSLHSGVLAEQVHPLTGAPLSVSPLTWSHATFCLAFQDYVRRWHELNQM